MDIKLFTFRSIRLLVSRMGDTISPLGSKTLAAESRHVTVNARCRGSRNCHFGVLSNGLVPCFSLMIVAFTTLAASAETPLMTLRGQTGDLLREQATVADSAKQDAAIAALCDMYVILRNDPRYSTSEMLKADASKVRRRLLTIARRREGQLKRQGIARPATLSAEVDSVIRSALSDDAGKVGDLAIPSAPGGGAVADQGWQLVELIQRVVAPDFWENRGGPGVIRYFAMRRVLVVRATTDVHEQIRDLLMALR